MRYTTPVSLKISETVSVQCECSATALKKTKISESATFNQKEIHSKKFICRVDDETRQTYSNKKRVFQSQDRKVKQKMVSRRGGDFSIWR